MADAVVLGEEWAEPVELEHELLSVEAAHRAASVYVDRGWAVTAGPGIDVSGVCSCYLGEKCRNAGKHAHNGWNNERRQTLSQEQIDKWWSPENPLWKKQPVDQVFIVPYLSGLVVMDVDRMEEWEALDASERPETLWASSGSGRGGHYLYEMQWDTTDAIPPRLPGKIKGGAGEIKFRGIIAAAPSVHRKGGRYTWMNWGAEVAPVPEKLLVSWTNPARRDLTLATVEAPDTDNPWIKRMYLADLGDLQGAGDARTSRPVVLFAAAASMGKWIMAGWITEEKVLELLLVAAEKNGTLQDYELDETIRQLKNGIAAGLGEAK